MQHSRFSRVHSCSQTRAPCSRSCCCACRLSDSGASGLGGALLVLLVTDPEGPDPDCGATCRHEHNVCPQLSSCTTKQNAVAIAQLEDLNLHMQQQQGRQQLSNIIWALRVYKISSATCDVQRPAMQWRLLPLRQQCHGRTEQATRPSRQASIRVVSMAECCDHRESPSAES